MHTSLQIVNGFGAISAKKAEAVTDVHTYLVTRWTWCAEETDRADKGIVD